MNMKSMDRMEALTLLNKYRTNEIVVPVYQAATTWRSMSTSHLDYTFTGAMGQGSSHALGIALGRPDKKIIILDGDGSLLMNLGSLVTIGNINPSNLVHCVCINGTYETNGSIQIPNHQNISFSKIAKAAGYKKILVIDNIHSWEKTIPELLTTNKLTFVELHMHPGNNQLQDNFKELYSTEQRNQFIETLIKT